MLFVLAAAYLVNPSRFANKTQPLPAIIEPANVLKSQRTSREQAETLPHERR